MILVAGEALIDLLPVGDDRTPRLHPVPGGSPFNVALALGRLRQPVRFLCRFSTDACGLRQRRLLEASHVVLDGCPITEALSTLGWVTWDDTLQSARYAFYTEGTAGCALEVSDLPEPFPEAIRAVHVGSFSLAIEPFGTALETLVQRASGRLVSLDPNIRPFLIPDREAFLGRYRRLLERADMVKLSLEDLEWLYPGAEPETVAREHLDRGVGLVVLTRGGEGSTAWTQQHRVSVPPPEVRVIDTVGAGDTFQAGLLAWLGERDRWRPDGVRDLVPSDLEAMLQFAAAAAAITCSRAGCDPPWIEELTRWEPGAGVATPPASHPPPGPDPANPVLPAGQTAPDPASPAYRGEPGRAYHSGKRSLDPAAAEWVYRLRAEKFRPWVEPHHTVFELGVGAGWNLARLPCARRLGADVSTFLAGAVTTLGIEFLEDPEVVPEALADVAICHQTLEHLIDPVRALRQLGRILKPGGRLVLHVPWEVERRHARYRPDDPNRHLFHWTAQSLGNLVTSLGWRIEHLAVRRYGYDRRAANLAARWHLGEAGYRTLRRLMIALRPLREVELVAGSPTRPG